MSRPDPKYDGIHGTATAYKGGCRCAACRYYQSNANKNVIKKRKAELTTKNGAPYHPYVTHGTKTGYRYGCRCEPCKKSVATKGAH